ncbi:MAG: dihydrofolate reductase family protein [Alphaproteobacteria bacterium]|nr:dihydrofolate reductase family protein [Alphaproteobacteria bacterium]
MAKLVFALNVSLDGYVDHDKFAPDPVLFEHFTEELRRQSGCLYGRRMYEIMRYWDGDDAEWTPAFRAYAEAWRAQKKFVVSRTLTSVGPNATLISGDLEASIRKLKADIDGEIEAAGPVLAGGLTELGLIDAYQLYFHPVVLGGGSPFFTSARPPLRLTASERIGNAMRLTCVPA